MPFRLFLLALLLLPFTTTSVYAIRASVPSAPAPAPAPAPAQAQAPAPVPAPSVTPAPAAAPSPAPVTAPDATFSVPAAADQSGIPHGFALPAPEGGQSAATDQDNSSDDYVDLTWPNLARTMVHFNALNLNDPVVIDEYSIITECDLFQAYYQDDFKWNAVRQAVRDSIKMNSTTYPVKYRYPLKMQLDRYDFAAKNFRFAKHSTLNNVNMFKLFTAARKTCGVGSVKSLPHDFRVVLASPVFLDGLPFSEAEAQKVLRRMEDDDDSDRILYTDFNIRVLYIEPLRKQSNIMEDSTTPPRYFQSDVHGWSDIRVDARLDSIDFYTDQARKHLIYKYVP